MFWKEVKGARGKSGKVCMNVKGVNGNIILTVEGIRR